MIDFSLEYRSAIDKITDKKEKDHGLRAFHLTERKWKLVEQLSSILKVFKHVTLFFSCSTPSLATVIPAMDHINEQLMTASLDLHYEPSICAAVSLVKKTLNCYYNITDHSEVYRIMMILHPKHKLDCFKTARWESDWIDMACHVLCTEYDHSYKGRSNVLLDASDNVKEPAPKKPSKQKARELNIFDSLLSLARNKSGVPQNELDTYLNMDTEDIDNPLICYVDQCRTLRALMCLSGWSLLGLVKDKDINAVAVLSDVDVEDEEDLKDGWDQVVALL
ncbi:hypothetical protein Hypma_005266 [Hypsizygus marmoreus]|uniref:HAT C-terminal dimerisation domain-containing protein n=1 Tax=Hypsizygus marmoreus TaxID=39966 RepID=A0A369K4K3_HYPMA|nr:hypothetical protein Hypma_005266 [Hypsizygus marmoreus]